MNEIMQPKIPLFTRCKSVIHGPELPIKKGGNVSLGMSVTKFHVVEIGSKGRKLILASKLLNSDSILFNA